MAVAAAPNLYVQRVVPHVCIREYGALILHSQRIADAVFDNAPMRRLLRTIPGLDDFAILGKVWHESVRAHSFDAIIFDGPATGHLRYTLGIPQAILRTLSVGPLPREARLMQDSLEDNNRVQAVLVGLPDRWPLSELGEMAGALREELHVNIGAVVVNGLWQHNTQDPLGLAPTGAATRAPTLTQPLRTTRFHSSRTSIEERVRSTEPIAERPSPRWRKSWPSRKKSAFSSLSKSS